MDRHGKRLQEFLALTPDQLAQVLRGFRRTARLSQQAVAVRGGLLQKTVSLLESQPQRASVETLYRLLSVLDVEVVLRPRRSPTPDRAEW